MSGLDKLVREIKPEKTLEVLDSYWNEIEKCRKEKKEIPRPLYMNLIQHTARRVLMKLEETDYKKETWLTYCEFFTSVMLSYKTSDMNNMLNVSERVLSSVLGFYSKPQSLLKEYLKCSVTQENQRTKELADLAAKRTTMISCPAPVDHEPEIEYEEPIVAVTPAFPVELVSKVLAILPTSLTFAHTNGLLYLRLLNPLPIPDCPFVTSGYACDSCRLTGIRVAFEAMLYEEDEVSTDVVRSNARIAQHYSHGYDMCVACAVFFYIKQESMLKDCFTTPGASFEMGVASGVSVKEYSYCCGEAIVTKDKKAAQTPKALGTNTPPTFLSSRGSSRSNSGSQSPKATLLPPATRCEVVDKCFIEIEVGIAPISSRPIAYILPSINKSEKLDVIKTYQPPPTWAERCTILKSKNSYNCPSDSCVICMCPFDGTIPTVKTKCGHTYHVECLIGFLRSSAKSDNVCPICRAAEPLPDVSLHQCLETNVFKLRIALTEEESKRKSVTVFVGALISRKNEYNNITNIAAGKTFVVKPTDLNKTLE